MTLSPPATAHGRPPPRGLHAVLSNAGRMAPFAAHGR